MATFEEVRDLMRRRKVAMVDLKYADLFGRWHHVTLPAGTFDRRTAQSGVPFDGSSVAGFKRKEAGDMVLIPDLATAIVDPFWEQPTLSLICETAEADTLAPFGRDPRYIARRAEKYLAAQGIADTSLWLAELEFYIFRRIIYAGEINSSFYRIESDEADWNTGSPDSVQLGHNIPHRGGYHATPPMDSLHNLRAEICSILEGAGVPVRYHHHEVGGPGQMEIELRRLPFLACADGVAWAKYAIKNCAMRHGHSATFMPKPLYDEAGSGMHFHQNLVKGRRNLFYDRSEPMALSETALHYIGGLLTHGRALLALTNPSTNSYKRLVPGFEAPTLLFYGLANRSAAVRVPKYTMQPSDQRIEYRPSDGSANVYLAMAAMLMAGIDGIRRRIDPSKHGMGPFNEDIRRLPETTLRKLVPIPTDLKEALDALENDHDFLRAGDVFPEDFFPVWIEQKTLQEYDAVRHRPHPHEMVLYYDV